MKKIICCLLSMAAAVWYSGCRDEAAEKVEVTGIKFSESSKSLSVGDISTIGMSVMPVEAKNQERVEYSVSRAGIIEIKEGSSNDGVIIEGKSRGTTALIGRMAGFVDYCSVTVSGSDERVAPHIISPVSVIQSPLRERRSITVSLAGGSPADNNGFIWSYTNQNVINMETTGNVCIFNTIEPGSCVITIRHPKAQYSIDILVFVLGSNESPVYITSGSNVIDIKKSMGGYEFQVELIGGLPEDNGRFVYQIIEGSNYILLNGNGRFGTITPKASGLALVRVTHPKAQYPFDVQVFVSEDLEYRYIDVDRTLVLMQEGESAVVQAKFTGDAPDDVPDRYDFSLSANGIINVSRSQGLFFINAVSKGKVILTVSNYYADFNREILIVVNNSLEGVTDNQKYIYTNQNVITMEAGGSDSILNMMLVGGNEGDKNSFIWTVDDWSIIEANTTHGVIAEPLYRAMYQDMPLEQFEAQAVITAKKTGMAKITLQHPKAKNETAVLVKVYPKGTFAKLPVVLGGQPYYKVERGKNTPVELWAFSGSAQDAGDIQWAAGDGTVAGIESAGLNGVINGLSNGITTLTVSGGNLKHPFSSVIIVNGANELNNQKFIYMLNPFMTLTVGQSVTASILGENMKTDDMKSIGYINNNNNIVEIHSNGNNMILTALKAGIAEILVKGNETNEIKITVTVEEQKINVEQPFYLSTGRDIIGIVKNQPVDINVELIGGSAARYESSVIWSVENGQIAQLAGSGKTARITGIAEGQTVVNASHPKSSNTVRIVIFIVANSGELNNKVALYVEKNNYLIEKGERLYISLKTSAADSQKAGLQWNIDNMGIVDFSVSADKMSVFITGLKTGSAQISVSHSQNIIPQIIHISVVSQKQNLKYISAPSIIETVAGNTLEVQAVTQNLEQHEIQNIKWTWNNSNIASIAGNGASCIIQARANGSGTITVEQSGIGFAKNIVVYIYSSYEEMASSYIMGSEQSYYRINRGDIIDVSLTFGAKGFPEHEISNIRWSVSDNNVVSAAGNGKNASIRALNSGVAYIYAEHDSSRNRKVTIEIEVIENTAVNNGYRFEIAGQDRIKGIVVGGYADILVKIFNGITEVTAGLNKIEFEAENPDIIGLTPIDNNVRVTAKKTGRSYVTIRHPNMAGSERILIYTASNAGDLNNMYPLFFEKSNYLLKKGDIIRIKAETMDEDASHLSNIHFSVEGSGIISIAEISRKEISVSALEKGNDVIVARYGNEIVQRIYVSVTMTVDSDLSAYLVTENIIGMVAGRMYETQVNANLKSYLLESIYWSSDNSSVVSVMSYNGIRAALKAESVGSTYVTVRSGSIERKILVFVCSSDQELRNYQAVNMEQRYFVINKGQSLPLNLFSYQGKVEGTTQYSDYYNAGGNFGNVIELSNKTAKSVTVNGRQEGVAGIRITNPHYNLDIVVYVEVQGSPVGVISGAASGNYITSAQTLYVIEPNEKNVNVQIDIIGSNFYQDGYFIWEGYDNSIINVKAQGRSALINPLKKGQTVIMVSNIYCDNTLPIMVIVGNRYNVTNNNEPYIYAENTVYEMDIYDASKIIYYELRNIHDTPSVAYAVNGNSVNVNAGNPGKLIVTPKSTGMTTVKITAEGVISVDLYFIVREQELGEAVYLTTVENFVIGCINEIKAVDVKLVGYNEIDSNQFKWSIDKKNIAQVMGNGNRAQIYSLSEGDAVITVTHYKARFPLTIHLRVAKNAASNQLVYLTTNTNVIEGLIGDENYIYVQKIGGLEYLKSCAWTVDNPSVVSVSGNDYTGIFKIKAAGTARISVKNVEVDYPLQIVVVAKEKTGSPMYINSSDTLLELVPGQANQRVTVSLEGGKETDNAGFNWSVYYQNPADTKIAMSNGNVVTLVANANQCNISAVNEGVARIRVTHNKADNPLYIVIQVSKYKQLRFPYNQKEMLAGESEFISINVPNYENLRNKVIFFSDNPEVCTMMGTNSTALLTAHSAGYAIIKAKIEGKDQEAELYVNVVGNEDPNINKIVTGKTSYAFHPRSGPAAITAQVCGLNINDPENDHIWWELINLDGLNEPVIDIYPAAAMDKVRGSREIQISPRREGEAQIVIGHRYVHPKYYKTINVLVSETSNAFTLDKNMVNLDMGKTQTLKASIIGAKTKDYDDIQWLVEYKLMFDGSRQEVIKLMGDGQSVTLYPVRDGTVEVQARYKGMYAVCTVTVESQQYFNVRAQSVRMYPGEAVDVPFDIRPVDTFITWYDSQYSLAMEDKAAKYEALLAQKTLRITAQKEGSIAITGIANGKTQQINVYVNYSYKVLATTYAQFNPVLEHTDSPAVLDYKVYPPNTFIEADIPAAVKNDVIIEIFRPDSKTGEGKIYISAKKELGKQNITWKQVKPDGRTYTEAEAVTVINVVYDPKEQLKPYFVRYNGVWSNAVISANGTPGQRPSYVAKSGERLGETLNGGGNTYSLVLGDGEEHYIVFDKSYPNSNVTWSKDITGDLSSLDKYGVKAQLVDITHNGNTVKALRLSGGPDVIDYTRVMFNKRLYVDVEANGYEGGITESKPEVRNLWINDYEVFKVTGTKPASEKLWYKKADYTYDYDESWYLYTNAQKEALDMNLVPASSIPNIIMVAGITAFPWASREPRLINGEYAADGYNIAVPMVRQGYYYSIGTINAYSELFDGVSWETAYPPSLNEKISLTEIWRAYEEYVYESMTVYVYSNNVESTVQNFEHVDSMEEDIWGNRVFILEQIANFAQSDFAFSFKKYTMEISTQQLSEPGISVWDVFNESGGNSWSKPWKLELAEPVEHHAVSTYSTQSAWYFRYEGLADEFPTVYRGYYGKVPRLNPDGSHAYEVNRTSPDRGHTFIETRTYLYDYKMLYQEVSRGPQYGNQYVKNVYFYGNPGYDVIGTSRGGYYRINECNTNGLNILGVNGNWSPYYARQAVILETGYVSNKSKGKDDGGSTYYEFFSLNNSKSTARQRYRWEDTGYNSIVPIKRMDGFPFRMKLKKQGVINEDEYIIDYKNPGNGVTSRPMPTLNTTKTNDSRTVDINVNYRLIDSSAWTTITFKITYEIRNCHALYANTAGNIDDMANTTNKTEIQGVPTWKELEDRK
ncbi:MAG: hypothetical protein LBU85_09795 [Treponema sp.]|jgi:hypothetical protein|nr:hypothetical protein [Treponema sp.]